MIVKSLENLSDSEVSTLKEQLVDKFVPDDMCPQGAFIDTQQKLYQYNDHASFEEAAPIFAVDDSLPDSFENHAKNTIQMAIEIPDLLSANQLLESVLEAAHQVGRLSVSTASDVSFGEMAHHCERLLMGKQEKISHLMSTQRRGESVSSTISQNCGEEDEQMASYVQSDVGFQVVGHPFVDQNVSTNSHESYSRSIPILCAADHNDPQSFRLPTSSPYDNFLKAAGC